jgi:hypothetical protein
MRTTKRGALVLAAGAALAVAWGLAAGTARADVTVKEKTVFDGLGETGRMASEGTSTLVVSGDKMRQETTTRLTGKLMKHFAGEAGLTSAAITRLDRRLFYQVNVRDKSYTELPLESAKDVQRAMSRPAPQGRPAEAQGKRPSLQCDPVKVEARRTGQKQAVNGFPAEEAVLEGTQACRNEEAKQACTNHYQLDYWATPVTPPLREVQAFYRKLAEAVGTDPRQMAAVAEASKGMMSHLAGGFAGVYKELSKQEGFPVRSRLTVESEGSCGLPGFGARGSGALEAPLGFGGMRDGAKGTSGRRRGERQAAPEGGAASPVRHKVFGLSSEIESVTASAAPPGAFDPPAGFTKKETGTRVPAEPKSAPDSTR